MCDHVQSTILCRTNKTEMSVNLKHLITRSHRTGINFPFLNGKRIQYFSVSTYPIKCQCCPHIEKCQLICTSNQLTGFYMRATLARNGLTTSSEKLEIFVYLKSYF